MCFTEEPQVWVVWEEGGGEGQERREERRVKGEGGRKVERVGGEGEGEGEGEGGG